MATNVKLPTLKHPKISVKGAKIKSVKSSTIKPPKTPSVKLKAGKKITSKVASPLKYKA